MRTHFGISLGLFALVGLVGSGCSGSGAASLGFNMGKNAARKDSHLKIMLDGHLAKQNTIEKAAKGYSRFDIAEGVATAPTLEFEIEDPDRFGRIKMVQLQIHKEHGDGYSNLAEYVVIASDTSNPDAQMEPGVEYDLGNPGAALRILDVNNQTVEQVTLEQSTNYMMSFSVVADKSETAQIYFQTK